MQSNLHILTSTRNRVASITNFLETLYGNDKKFHTLKIATGYWDSSSIKQTILWAKTRKSLRERARFELFLNATKRDKTIEKLVKLNSEIRNEFPHKNSGIYLITRGFLHMKAYYIQGTTNAVLSIGSNNFTENSILNNEEAMMYLTFDPRQDKSNGHKKVDLLNGYLEQLKLNAKRQSGVSALYIGDLDSMVEKCDSLVDYLLNYGELWTELRANSPYQLQLNLPDDLLEAAAPNFEALEAYIDAEAENSLSARKLIDRCRKLNPRIKNRYQSVLEENKATKLPKGSNNWTKYAIETSLGYWAPIKYRDFIKMELHKQKYKEIEHLANLEILRKHPEALKGEFVKFVDAVIDTILKENINTTISSPWYFSDLSMLSNSSYANERRKEIQNYWSRRWDDHVENLKDKLCNEEFRIRLVRGISSIAVPDMRSDKFVLDAFVQSFLSSFEYHSSLKRIHKQLCRDSEAKQLVSQHTK